MSFGFGVGDFIAVGELCWKIYTRVYKVSRDAPEELRALIQELGNLSNTVNLLNEEVQDQEEWMKRAGERRLEYTCKVMGQVKATLQKMDQLADKYAELGKGGGLEGSRRPFRIQWNRVKFAFEVSSINELRAKLDELRNLMIGHRISPENPLLNAPLDDEDRAELSAAFLRSSEIGDRPWASIGIDDWLHAGKWWLLKARSEFDHMTQGYFDTIEAYINLLKACWILTDMVSIHPQRTHLGASNDRRNDDIRNLSQIAKTSLENFPVVDFKLQDLADDTMKIWPQAPPSSPIRSLQQFGIGRDNLSWQTSNREVVFQCFVEIRYRAEEDFEYTWEECFLLVGMPQEGFYLDLAVRGFSAQSIWKLRFEPVDNYDIGSPVRSDRLAILLRAIVDDLAKIGDKDKYQSREFLAKDCLNISMPLGTFVWKLICWHCDKFADFKSLLEGFNPAEPLRDSLLQTAFLRLDRDFLDQVMQLRRDENGWHPRDVLVMVEAALSSDDVGYLLWIFDTVAASVLSEQQTAISQVVYRSKQLEHIDAMMQVVDPRPADVAATLAWFLGSSDEQGFTDFLHIVHSHGVDFSSNIADDVNFLNFCTTFVAGCCRLIESQCSDILGLYIDSLRELGIRFHRNEGRKNTESSQLAILPALASPDSSFLRVLLEREVVQADVPPFILEYESEDPISEMEVTELAQYPPPLMPHWPLYLAIVLVCDTEFLRLICQHGASLQQEIKSTQDNESEVQGIIERISNLSSLEDARLEYMEALWFCHNLIQVGMKGRKHEDLNSIFATHDTPDHEEAWRCMEGLLYRDSFFLSCSFLCHESLKGSLKGLPGACSELISRYTEYPEHYSKHLRTQTSWDIWRRDALKILTR
ncbi:hypothetical protein FPANT_5885 [Fusarium pseudoanthophilum]|uniref:Uncharacterized protein n=1 Tax=Fusarium pseudoanthophilum TaxID=48495 RepID=A0A8H5LFC9_9HYPO|nr:hypothetical protein FPANT_5885 [Fusarium pseudoanthophilum]